MTESPLLNLKEACAFLRHGETWVRERANEIGVIRDGKDGKSGKLLFERAALERWVARHRVLEPSSVVTLPARPAPRTAAPAHLRGRINPLDRKPYLSPAERSAP